MVALGPSYRCYWFSEVGIGQHWKFQVWVYSLTLVLVSLGSYNNKMPGWENDGNLSFTSQKLWSPRSRDHKGDFILKPCLLTCRWVLLLCTHVTSVCMESFIKMLISSWELPSPGLIHPPKDPIGILLGICFVHTRISKCWTWHFYLYNQHL